MTDETDYTKIKGNFAAICGDDAMKWAIAFVQHAKKNAWKLEDIDEGLMVGWFANAMAQSEPVQLTEEESLHIAARVWCRPEIANMEMNTPLAVAFADVLRNGEPVN